MIKFIQKLIFIVAIILFIAPGAQVVFSQSGGNGSCCPETRSKCYIGGELKNDDHYYNSDGPCNDIPYELK